PRGGPRARPPVRGLRRTITRRRFEMTQVDPTESYARGPDEPPVRNVTLGQMLAEAAEHAPDQLALFGTRDARRWTYTELLADAQAGARGLLGRFQPGERLAIWGQNLPEWVLAEYACALSGVVIVTINPNLGPDEAAYIINQSSASGVLASTSYRGRDLAA